MGERPGLTLGEIASALGAALEGDAATVVTGVATLEDAGPDQIAFVTDGRYHAAALASRAGAFLASDDAAGLPGPVLRCRAPRLAVIDLLGLFYPPGPPRPGVHRSAVVAADARVAGSASIGALAVVEAGAIVGEGVCLHPLVYVGRGVEIGEGSMLYPHVVVREGVRLGRRVVVHPGAVIGADGFGFAFDGARHRKIPQVGGVVIEDDVEIGANTTVDRATLGQTVVRRGTKIDNLVQVGHNTEIGENALIAAQTGIAGSCRIGRGVVLGGQVGVGDHVHIGDAAMLGSQSGVMGDVAAGEKLTGTYGRPVAQALRIWVAQAQLPDLIRQVRSLERRLARLERRLPHGGKDGPGEA
jgi:UDP-3-O-[3-hydroxymyristoyl] glucosamine N-acyltransferase